VGALVGGEVGDLCKHLERVFDVNVKGAMLVVRQLLRRDALVEKGGELLMCEYLSHR
jgi:hypothetical protein